MKSKIEAEDGPQAEDRKEEEHHWSRRAINVDALIGRHHEHQVAVATHRVTKPL